MLATTATATATASAEEGEIGGPPPIETHGFVSQGGIKSTDYNYLVNSKRGSADFTEVGINFTTRPTDNLRLGVQLFARRLGTTGNFNAKADWFYFDYHWRDWLGLRAGRVKLPFGLYNEINDVDSARTAILMPQSLYPLSSRDFLLAQNGAELYGYVRLGDEGGALDYRLYGGALQVDIPNQTGSPLQIASVETPYVAGGRLLWETPLDGLRVGGSVQALRLNLNVSEMMMPFTLAIPAVLWVASAEYTLRDLLLAGEYGRWYSSLESSAPMLFPGTGTVTSERLYGMATYRVNPMFQPGAYYSLFFPNVSNRNGIAANQHDWALTLRFDVNTHFLVKVEGHYMHHAAGLTSALNGGAKMDTLTNDWLVLLVKMTAYF